MKVEVPAEWKNIVETKKEGRGDAPEFVKNIADPMNRLEGDNLPVSAFSGMQDGTFPQGTTAYEKRGIAVQRAGMAAGKLHPVQPVRVCMSSRGHTAVPAQ